MLLRWTDTKTEYAESLYLSYLKKRWEKEVAALAGARVDFAAFWHGALHDGVVSIEGRAQALRFQLEALRTVPAATEPTGGFVVILAPSHYLKDGSFAANGWLQELPHPVSKVVWDNYAAISPKMATEMSLAEGDIVKINDKLELPVLLQPGQPYGVIAIALGYGHTEIGAVGNGIGANAFPYLGKYCALPHLRGLRIPYAACRQFNLPCKIQHAFDGYLGPAPDCRVNMDFIPAGFQHFS